jgi:glutamine amidotransferase
MKNSQKSFRKIIIIDYGSGNLQSVLNAIISLNIPNCQALISKNPQDLYGATHIILPGVGAFGDCASELQKIPDMVETLRSLVLVEKRPFLGICVGMQLLADIGNEHGKNKGLGFISGQVNKIDSKNGTLKVPHIGWNNIKIKPNKTTHPILKDIPDEQHFYFVHSYHFEVENKDEILATVDYGAQITAIIAKDNIVATQFHPEKSSTFGLKLLENFIKNC